MKTVSNKRLKQLAKTYRKTKRYPMAARIAEYEYLQNNWTKVEEIRKRNGFNLETSVGLIIGLWQCKHGFYLTSRQVFGNKLKKKLKLQNK